MSIIKETSGDYFARKFGAAMFFGPEGVPCILPSNEVSGLGASTFTQDGKVRAFALEGTAEKPSKKELFIEKEFFDSMERFSVPDLGWRAAAEGRVMVHFARATRTYKKGVCLDSVEVRFAGHTMELMDTGNVSHEYYNRPTTKALMILTPVYTPLAEGLEGMNSGKIIGFALSANLAVLPGDGDNYQIAYGMQVVGTLSPDGSARMSIKRSLEDLL
jgi:hypothetical protein